MTIWVCTLTVLWLVLAMFLVGKFFCLDVCESIYEALDDSDDGREMCISFWGCSTLGLIIAWIGVYFHIKLMIVLSSGITSFFTLYYWVIFIFCTVTYYIIPNLKEMHYSIKRKKRESRE